MILDTIATVYSRTPTKNTKGQVINTFSAGYGLVCNVQPAALNESQAQAWGVADLAANAKKLFCRPTATLSMLDRIDAQGSRYEVRGINTWPNHIEALLIPIQGV